MIHWPQKVWGRDYKPILCPSDDPDLLCGYDMAKASGELLDQSGNGNNGIVTPFAPQVRTILGPALNFDGAINGGKVDTSLSLSEINPRTDSHTVECWFRTKPITHVKPIIGKGISGNWAHWINGGIEIQTSGALYYYQYTGTAYEGIATEVIQPGLLYHVAYSVDWENNEAYVYVNGRQYDSITPNMLSHAPSDAINWLIGLSGSAALSFDESFDGEILAPRFHKRVLTQEEIEKSFSSGVKTRQYYTDWGVHESITDETSGYLSNTPIRIISGTWRIITTVIRGIVCKAIKCISSGRLAIPASLFFATPTESAFGGWRFWLYKGSSTTQPRIMFVATTTGLVADAGQLGYYIQIDNTQTPLLRRMTGGGTTALDTGTSGGFPIQTWTEIDLGRRHDGLIGYHQDKIQDMGATDLNQLTSKYIVPDLDTGDIMSFSDRIGGHNIQKTLGPLLKAA